MIQVYVLHRSPHLELILVTPSEATRINVTRKARKVSSRAHFIDHIQRVEAYLNGADLDEVEQETLPDHLKDAAAAEYAARLFDSTTSRLRKKIDRHQD